jgi:hypothetical protein
MILFLLAKFVAYTAWCYFGFYFFRTPGERTLFKAIGLGFVRIGMGFIAAIIIIFLFAGIMSRSLESNYGFVVAYFGSFVIVRLAEWWLESKLYWKGEVYPNIWLWLCGGAFISCAFDIPFTFGVLTMNKWMC